MSDTDQSLIIKKRRKKIRDIEQFNEITFTANYDKRSEFVPDKGFFFRFYYKSYLNFRACFAIICKNYASIYNTSLCV